MKSGMKSGKMKGFMRAAGAAALAAASVLSAAPDANAQGWAYQPGYRRQSSFYLAYSSGAPFYPGYAGPFYSPFQLGAPWAACAVPFGQFGNFYTGNYLRRALPFFAYQYQTVQPVVVQTYPEGAQQTDTQQDAAAPVRRNGYLMPAPFGSARDERLDRIEQQLEEGRQIQAEILEKLEKLRQQPAEGRAAPPGAAPAQKEEPKKGESAQQPENARTRVYFGYGRDKPICRDQYAAEHSRLLNAVFGRVRERGGIELQAHVFGGGRYVSVDDLGNRRRVLIERYSGFRGKTGGEFVEFVRARAKDELDLDIDAHLDISFLDWGCNELRRQP